MQFLDILKQQGVSDGRMLRYVQSAKRILYWKNKDFNKYNQKDVNELLKKIDEAYAKNSTQRAFRLFLKYFFKVTIGKNRDYPDLVRHIMCKKKLHQELIPEAMLEQKEVQRMIEVCNSDRDKCLISMSFESTCRPSEILNMRLSDIRDENNCYKVFVAGKTGVRPIFFIDSIPYIKRWLDKHPYKNDSNRFLFCNESYNYYGDGISVASFHKILKKAMRRAGIKKPSNPYHMRKSGLTFYAEYMPEQLLKQQAGHKPNSAVLDRYIKLSSSALKKKKLELSGVREEKLEKSELRPKICHRCNENNEPSRKYCYKCLAPLTLDAIQKYNDLIDMLVLQGRESLVKKYAKEKAPEFLEALIGLPREKLTELKKLAELKNKTIKS